MTGRTPSPVEVAAKALREANRYPEAEDAPNEWAATCRQITERDARAVVDALAAAGLLLDPDDIPVADAYSREEFGEAEAWGWNACRDFVLNGGSDA
jgi:hypothetical protein